MNKDIVYCIFCDKEMTNKCPEDIILHFETDCMNKETKH